MQYNAINAPVQSTASRSSSAVAIWPGLGQKSVTKIVSLLLAGELGHASSCICAIFDHA